MYQKTEDDINLINKIHHIQELESSLEYLIRNHRDHFHDDVNCDKFVNSRNGYIVGKLYWVRSVTESIRIAQSFDIGEDILDWFYLFFGEKYHVMYKSEDKWQVDWKELNEIDNEELLVELQLELNEMVGEWR